MKPASFEATPPMLFHQVFRQGKLEATRKQNYIYKTKFHCSPRTENQIISVKPSFTVRPARRMPLVLLEGCRSSCWEGAARSARRMPLALLEVCRSPRPKRIARPARRVHLTPLGGCISLRSEGTSHSARRVHLTPLGGYRSPCSEGASHPARRIHLTPLGGYIPLRSEGTFHSARRVHLTPLGGCISLRSEGAFHSTRRVHLTPLGGYIPLRSEGTARPARSDAPMLFHQVFRQGKLEANIKQNYIYKTKFHCSPCSEGVVPRVVRSASTIKSEKYFRNIRDKSRAGIGVYFVEYGVNFRLRKCHYCKSRF